MEKRPNIDLLQSTLTNAQTGINAINYILPEVQSDTFKAMISNQQTQLKEIEDKCRLLAKKSKIEIKDNGCLKNAKMWLSVKMGSFVNDDTQHLAELLIMGYFFGIINMMKSLADAIKAKQDILNLARELKTLEEKSLNKLVPYLERTKQ